MSSSYIVTFKNDTPEDVIKAKANEIEQSGATITHRYNAAIKGFSVNVPDTVVNTLSFDDPHLNRVEADGEVTTQGQGLLT